ncbi:hypothetical protein JTI58_14540 [Lysinibacillus fusiformis]|nr:hypothetical protein JTI58_14540 [Lysinibacillus fusiformis]
MGHGVIGAAGVLPALVPGSMLLLSVATLLAKNVYGVFVPTATEKQIVQLAKFLVPFVALIALFFTFQSGTIVALLLMGASMVTQLFPSLMFSLMKNNFVTRQGAFAGIIMGEATVAYITLSKMTIATSFPLLPHWMKDVNVGFIALLLNVMVMLLVSRATQKSYKKNPVAL